jgi:hypothetical protein
VGLFSLPDNGEDLGDATSESSTHWLHYKTRTTGNELADLPIQLTFLSHFNVQRLALNVQRSSFGTGGATRSALPEEAKAGSFAKRRLRTLNAER